MTPEELAAIRARLESRPSPDIWRPIGGGNPYHQCVMCGATNVHVDHENHACEDDQEGQDIAGLLAEVDSLNGECDEWEIEWNKQADMIEKQAIEIVTLKQQLSIVANIAESRGSTQAAAIQREWTMCIDGGPHRFPNPWFGTVPPNCELCGRRSG